MNDLSLMTHEDRAAIAMAESLGRMQAYLHMAPSEELAKALDIFEKLYNPREDFPSAANQATFEHLRRALKAQIVSDCNGVMQQEI